MSISMSTINFFELFLIQYKDNKKECNSYMQPRMILEGNNLLYYDIIDKNKQDD